MSGQDYGGKGKSGRRRSRQDLTGAAKALTSRISHQRERSRDLLRTIKPQTGFRRFSMHEFYVVALLFAFLTRSVSAAQPVPAPDVSHLALPGASGASVDSRLLKARGEVEIVVRLGDPPLAVAHGEGAKQRGGRLTPAEQRGHVAGLSRKHDDLMGAVRALGGREVARLTKSLNAVIMRVDGSRLSALAALPNVVSIRP